MKAKKIREMLGLTVPQAADELNIPRQDLMDGEENEEAYLLARYIAVFPVNPEILSNPQAAPFLPSYVAGTPGSRMRAWREENGISATCEVIVRSIDPVEAFVSRMYRVCLLRERYMA